MNQLRITAIALCATIAGVIPARATAASITTPPAVRNSSSRDNERMIFTWTGRVDREVVLVMRGRDLTVRGERGILASRKARPRTGTLPRTEGFVRVHVLDGRGDVDVIQQPTSRNNYTTIVRIRDPRSGDDRYRLVASWEPNGRSGRYDPRDPRNRERINNRNRRDDRGRIDDHARDIRRNYGLRW